MLFLSPELMTCDIQGQTVIYQEVQELTNITVDQSAWQDRPIRSYINEWVAVITKMYTCTYEIRDVNKSDDRCKITVKS